VIRALALLLILTVPAMADCPGTLLPPPEYSGTPRELIDVRFLPIEVVNYDCVDKVSAEYFDSVFVGCEWREGGKWYAELAEGPSEYGRCRVLHMNGHVVTYERTGDPNGSHQGWGWGL